MWDSLSAPSKVHKAHLLGIWSGYGPAGGANDYRTGQDGTGGTDRTGGTGLAGRTGQYRTGRDWTDRREVMGYDGTGQDETRRDGRNGTNGRNGTERS